MTEEQIQEIEQALSKASTQHPWDTDGTFIQWEDGHPLKGTYRQIALTQSLTPEIFKNENHENDAHLIVNTPTWLAQLLTDRKSLQQQQKQFIESLKLIQNQVSIHSSGYALNVYKLCEAALQQIQGKE